MTPQQALRRRYRKAKRCSDRHRLSKVERRHRLAIDIIGEEFCEADEHFTRTLIHLIETTRGPRRWKKEFYTQLAYEKENTRPERHNLIGYRLALRRCAACYGIGLKQQIALLLLIYGDRNDDI